MIYACTAECSVQISTGTPAVLTEVCVIFSVPPGKCRDNNSFKPQLPSKSLPIQYSSKILLSEMYRLWRNISHENRRCATTNSTNISDNVNRPVSFQRRFGNWISFQNVIFSRSSGQCKMSETIIMYCIQTPQRSYSWVNLYVVNHLHCGMPFLKFLFPFTKTAIYYKTRKLILCL
jgi:hypothetical protein